MNILPVSDLARVLPHRPPFVWIDEVLEVTADGGICRVEVHEGAQFLDRNGTIRPSSFIEFMAQGFALTRVAHALDGRGVGALPKKLDRAFLVAITDSRCIETRASSFRVHLTGTRAIGPITLFSGKVYAFPDGEVVAEARLKVFGATSETAEPLKSS